MKRNTCLQSMQEMANTFCIEEKTALRKAKIRQGVHILITVVLKLFVFLLYSMRARTAAYAF